MTSSNGRRRALAGLAAIAAGALGAFAAGRPARAQAKPRPIVQPKAASATAFIARAFALRDQASRAGDQGYGAIVVKGGRIVGEGPSRVVVNKDPSAHAEMEAIRDAAARLGTRDLSGCTLYSSSPPCAMCETAAYWANVDRKVYGRGATDGGRPRYGGCA